MVGVLGFSGRKRSGKTTISQAVASALGWEFASFGDFVRHEALTRNLDPTSVEVLQDLGEKLALEGWPDFCQRVLQFSGWTQETGLVVDGIRHREAADTIASLVSPLPFALVHLSTDVGVMLQRRSATPLEDFKVLERHSTESQVLSLLPSIADLTLDGAAPIEATVGTVVSYVNERWA